MSAFAKYPFLQPLDNTFDVAFILLNLFGVISILIAFAFLKDSPGFVNDFEIEEYRAIESHLLQRYYQEYHLRKQRKKYKEVNRRKARQNSQEVKDDEAWERMDPG